jgi:hypothetical protein
MKKWRKRIGWAFAVLLLLAALLAWEGLAVAMIRFAGNAHEPRLNSDFKVLAELLPNAGSLLTEMYIGLSHPYAEKDEFVRELWSQSNRSINGYRFHQKPASPSASVKSELVAVLSNMESFRPYQGPKLCGGYHADFAVRLDSDGVSTWFLVCLGCGEVLIYSNDKQLICELKREAELQLEETWRDHQGIPFASIGSRLPIEKSVLTELGLKGHDARNPAGSPYPPPASLGKVYVRSQTLYWAEVANSSFKLREETYGAPEQAELRAKEVLGQVESAHGRKGTGFGTGFAFVNRVYWIEGRRSADLGETRKILERIRRYCEETQTHDVRFYD